MGERIHVQANNRLDIEDTMDSQNLIIKCLTAFQFALMLLISGMSPGMILSGFLEHDNFSGLIGFFTLTFAVVNWPGCWNSFKEAWMDEDD